MKGRYVIGISLLFLIVISIAYLLGHAQANTYVFSDNTKCPVANDSKTFIEKAEDIVQEVVVGHQDFNKDSGSTLNFSKNVKDFLLNQYSWDKEYTACIDGSMNLRSIYLDRITIYKTGQADYVEGIQCSALAQLHSHTTGNCYASNADIYSFKQYAARGVMFFIIQCDTHHLMIYSQEDYSRGFDYEI